MTGAAVKKVSPVAFLTVVGPLPGHERASNDEHRHFHVYEQTAPLMDEEPVQRRECYICGHDERRVIDADSFILVRGHRVTYPDTGWAAFFCCRCPSCRWEAVL
jgi:hypothetical protein